MPAAHDSEPIVAVHFTSRHGIAHSVDKYLRSTTWQASESGILQPRKDFLDRELVDLGEVMQFGRAEAVHIQLGKMRLDILQQLLVPVELEVRVQPPLHQDLVTTKSHGLFDLAEQFCAGQDPALFTSWRPVEGTKVTDRRADVGVVDIAVDVVGSIWLGMQSAGDGIGGPAERWQIIRL